MAAKQTKTAIRPPRNAFEHTSPCFPGDYVGRVLCVYADIDNVIRYWSVRGISCP